MSLENCCSCLLQGWSFDVASMVELALQTQWKSRNRWCSTNRLQWLYFEHLSQVECFHWRSCLPQWNPYWILSPVFNIFWSFDFHRLIYETQNNLNFHEQSSERTKVLQKLSWSWLMTIGCCKQRMASLIQLFLGFNCLSLLYLGSQIHLHELVEASEKVRC
jgi:hypothetical protein